MSSRLIDLPRPYVRAFSLVEMIIVLVIIGIIAAIAVPRLSSGARCADESALIGDLSAMRRSIDIYAAEHEGKFPGAKDDGAGGVANTDTAFIRQITKYTNGGGKVSDVSVGAYIYGPYLRTVPPIPVGTNKGNTTIAIDIVNSPPLVTAGTEGWVYNPKTGEIIANCDDANMAGSRAYDEY